MKTYVNNMIYLYLTILIGLAHYSTGQPTQTEWLTDFEIAKTMAQESKKPILMRIQGSDWCGNCWRLDSTLFETKTFEEYVEQKYVLLVLDFPNKTENKLPVKQAAKNKVLFERYNAGRGFPALIMVDPRGKIIGRMSVAVNSKEGYIEELETIYNKKHY